MSTPVSSNLDFGGAARCVNHPDPVNAQDVATKAYVDKDDAVTNAKLANVPSPSLKGRTTTGTGDPEDLTLVDSASAIWNTGTGGSVSIERAALTGDVTAAANSNVTAIAPGVIVDADINAAAAIAQTKTGALTGDITKASGSSTTAIAAGVIVNADVSSSAAISLSKLATQTANSIVANASATTTTPSALAIAADSIPARVGGNLVSHPLNTLSGAGLVYSTGVVDVGGSTSIVVGASDVQRAALTGDVTADQNSNATTIAVGAVSNAKLAGMGEATIKGRALASGSGAPEDLTGLQVGDITRLRSASTGAVSGTFNDYPIADGVRILECASTGGDVTFTGFAYGSSNAGAWFWLTKYGSANRIIIKHQDAGSLAANRVDTPNATDFVISEANRGVLVAWNNSRLQVVEGQPGVTWRGAWDNALSYAPTDVVERDGSSYIALREVPTPQDPAIAVVEGDLHGFSWPVTPSSLGAYSYYHGVVVGSSHLTVRRVRVGFSTTTAGVLQFGIAATLGATPASTVFIGDTGAVASPGAIGGFEYDLLSPVTLVPGTTYYVVARYASGGQPRVLGKSDVGNAITGGYLSKSGEAGYRTTTSNTTAWTASNDYMFDLTLIGDNHYWDVVARRGMDAPSDAISNAQLVDMPSPRLKGRTSPSSGDPEDLNLVDSASNAWNTATGGSISLERAALSGDVTAPANSNATTIANDVVTNGKLANVPSPSLKGRTTATAGDPEDLTLADSTSATWNAGTGGSLSIERAALTGDITAPANSNVTAIAPGVIVDADINAAAAIAQTKTGALTGDITKAAGSSATAIAAGVIVNADVSSSAAIALSKLATQTANTLVANATGSTTTPAALSIAADSIPARVGGNLVSHPLSTLSGAGLVYSTGVVDVGGSTTIVVGASDVQRAALTGDVTADQNSNATTIAAGVVSNAKLFNMADATVKGRPRGDGLGAPSDLTGNQVGGIVRFDNAIGDASTNGTVATYGIQATTNSVTFNAVTNVIHGFTAPAEPGQILCVQHIGAGTTTLVNESSTATSSSDRMRISNYGSNTQALVLGAMGRQTAWFLYTGLRWVYFGGDAPPLAGCGTFQSINLSVGNNDNLGINDGVSIVFFTVVAAGDALVTGLKYGAGGSAQSGASVRCIKATGTGRIVFKHEGATSDAANRLFTPRNVDWVLTYKDESVHIARDTDASGRWRFTGGRTQPNEMTNVELADMPDSTVKGRGVGAGTGDPVDLTGLQLGQILRMDSRVDDASTSGTGTPYTVALGTNWIRFIALTGAYTLDGCDLTTAGKIIIWHLEPGVVGSLVLKHNSGALANGYRFFCPGAVDLTLRSGEVAVTVYTSNRHRVISVSRAWSDAPSENRSITTTETRSDTTRILGPALTIPANTLQVGTVYRFTAHWEFLHTAGADPGVTFDLDLSGSAGTAVTVYPASTAGSFSGATEVILSVRSTGPSGTAAVSKRVITDAATRAVWGRSDSDDVDTTVANTFTLFGKLSSTVAGNSLIVWNSLAERIT